MRTQVCLRQYCKCSLRCNSCRNSVSHDLHTDLDGSFLLSLT
ncbi:hypothetical protein M758_12G121500 [Ceratodon purpureus]|nr:hypothetical protein M758_12G121500 [Ceratodon purpureus]